MSEPCTDARVLPKLCWGSAALQPGPVPASRGSAGPSVGHHEHLARKHRDASAGSRSRLVASGEVLQTVWEWSARSVSAGGEGAPAATCRDPGASLQLPARGPAPDKTRGRPRNQASASLRPRRSHCPVDPAHSTLRELLVRAGPGEEPNAVSALVTPLDRPGRFAGSGAPHPHRPLEGEQASRTMKAPDGTQRGGEKPLKCPRVRAPAHPAPHRDRWGQLC